MHVTQVSNHVLVDNSAEQEDLLRRIWCMLLDHSWVALITKEHEAFHLPHVLHALILLHEIVSHSLLDHVSSGHVSTNCTLQDLSVLLDCCEHLTEPSHSEVGLDS